MKERMKCLRMYFLVHLGLFQRCPLMNLTRRLNIANRQGESISSFRLLELEALFCDLSGFMNSPTSNSGMPILSIDHCLFRPME